ncbi:MAG: hypothetical protein R6V10_09365 [bacterium]
MRDHQKLMTTESRFNKPVFADHYHYGETKGEEIPFIIYVGGALTEEEYIARQDTTPDAIVYEFDKAVAEQKMSSADLLIIPPPVSESQASGKLRKEFLHFVVFDLLPLTSNPRPQNTGFVGFSFGAFLAACLTFDLPRSRALATLGGTGMAEAAWDSPAHAFADKKFKAFATADDPMAMENYKFLHALVANDIDMDPELGEGGHSFDDYVNTGFVVQAFSFVLAHMPHIRTD